MVSNLGIGLSKRFGAANDIRIGQNSTALTNGMKLLENTSLEYGFRGLKGFVDPFGEFVTMIYTAGTTLVSQLDLSAIPIKVLRPSDPTEFLQNLTERLIYSLKMRGFDASQTALVATK